jgi:hypothetical protein
MHISSNWNMLVNVLIGSGFEKRPEEEFKKVSRGQLFRIGKYSLWISVWRLFFVSKTKYVQKSQSAELIQPFEGESGFLNPLNYDIIAFEYRVNCIMLPIKSLNFAHLLTAFVFYFFFKEAYTGSQLSSLSLDGSLFSRSIPLDNEK